MRLIWSQRWRRRWRNSAAAALGALAALFLAPLAAADPAPIGDQPIEIFGPEGSGVLPAFASRPLLARAAGVLRLVIVIADPSQAPDAMLQHIMEALGAAGDETLVVAPQFLDADAARGLPADRLRWAGTAWTGGARSAQPAPLSAFAVLDSLLHALADPALRPDLQAITLAGADDGADLVGLYAAVTTRLADLQQRGLALRFVLAEPTHYLYLDQARPVTTDTACAEADRWPFGVDAIPDYAGPIGAAPILRRLQTLDIVYLLGGAVPVPGGESCAATVQGPDRTNRGRFYLAYLAALTGAPLHHLAELPEAADAGTLLASPCGIAALLNRPADCPALASAPAVPSFPVPPPPPSPPASPPAAPAEPPAPVEQVEPGGIADPLHDANPLAPIFTRKPPAPRPAAAPTPH